MPGDAKKSLAEAELGLYFVKQSGYDVAWIPVRSFWEGLVDPVAVVGRKIRHIVARRDYLASVCRVLNVVPQVPKRF